MNDFAPCCLKRIGELDRESLKRTKEVNAKSDSPCDIVLSGVCRVCGTWLEFNDAYWMYQGELDLGRAATVEWVDQDSVVRPD